MDKLMATVIGTAVGILGTFFGGVIAILLKGRGHFGKKVYASCIEFAAGLMISISVFDLLPHSFEYTGTYSVFASLIAGCIMAAFLQNYMKYGKKRPDTTQNRMLSTGIMMTIAIALHNFPEGLAVGSGLEVSQKLGLSLAFAMFCHDIPEGMSLALPLVSANQKMKRVAWISFLAGVPMAPGAFIGALMGDISKTLVGISLSFSAGTMLYMSIADLMPEARDQYKGRLSSIFNLVGMLYGLLLSLI